MTKVYGWMAAGLCVTAVIAMFVADTPAVYQVIFSNRILFYGLMIGELGLVIFLSARIMKMSAGTATASFLLYSALNGLTLSVIFFVYTRGSITSTFLITAGTFAAMSMYGYTTKKDLTSWGSFLIMGLIGLIIATVVNIFLKSTMVYWITTYAGVLIFVGLTAYDTQKIKKIAAQVEEGTEEFTKLSILGALTLYLDFINLFLYLLRLFGKRK